MSIQSIARTIEEEVEEKKKNISSYYENLLQEFEEELNQSLDTYEKVLYKEYGEEFKREESSLLGNAQSKANSEILAHKKAYEEQVKEEAKRELQQLDKQSRKNLYKNMIKTLSSEIDFSSVEVAPEDKELVSALLPKSCTIKTNNSFLGGLRVYSKDSRQVISMEFSQLLEEVFNQ